MRTVWRAAEASQGIFGHFLRYALLIATRRNEAARIRREELDGGDWLIPGSRHKSKRDFLLPLSGAARAELAKVPTIGRGNDRGRKKTSDAHRIERGYVFTSDGKRPLGGFSKFKRKFDKTC